MKLLFLFGARYHYHHDIIGAQWGNLMIPLYDSIVFLLLGGFFPAGDLVVVGPRRGKTSQEAQETDIQSYHIISYHIISYDGI